MLLLLISLGRMTIVAAATILTALFGAAGWVAGMYMEASEFGFTNKAAVTPYRILFALVSICVGLVVSGSLFGLIAAVFDIQISLRVLAAAKIAEQEEAKAKLDEAYQTYRRRIEPHL